MITAHYTNFNNAWASMIGKVMNTGERMYADSTLVKETMDVTAAIVLEGAAIDQILKRQLHPQYPQQHGLQSYINQFNYDADEYIASDAAQPYTYAGRMRDGVRGWTPKVYERGLQLHTMDYVDLVRRDIPCLQRIWIRYFPDETCEVHLIFRSHDLYGAWQFNMIALVNFLTMYVLGDYRIKKIVEFNDSLHIYDYDWDAAARVKQQTRLLK